MPRLYRDRADCENVFQELKNQWGWNGYTTHQLAPCRLMVNLIALIYNSWNFYKRFYDEEHHREAITSRLALKQGVARQVQSDRLFSYGHGVLGVPGHGDVSTMSPNTCPPCIHYVQSLSPSKESGRHLTL